MTLGALNLQPFGSDMHLCHATSVAVDGKAILIAGTSGTGKSALALQMIGLGAQLVADDQTVLNVRDGQVWAQPPTHLTGLIEARGVGLLNAPFVSQAPLALIVDMDRSETHRLPDQMSHILLDVEIPLAYRVDAPHFAAALRLYLKRGRRA